MSAGKLLGASIAATMVGAASAGFIIATGAVVLTSRSFEANALMIPFLGALMGLVYGWIASLGHVLLLGLPAYLLISRRGVPSRWGAGLAGFIIGFFPSSVFFWSEAPGQDPMAFDSWSFPLAFGLAGALAGLSFVAVMRGDDAGTPI